MDDRQRAYQQTVIIVTSMIMGQLIFAAVAWFLYSSGARTGEEPIRALLIAWLALAIGGIGAALFLRGRLANVDPHAQVNPPQVQTQIIIMWALLEGPGLLGIVIYFLEGNSNMLYAALGFVIASAIFFFPRREWFGREV